ncbi:hypothetical protein [Natronococcus sp.]|nr:hypothetical protein [Natronococcus sp.]
MDLEFAVDVGRPVGLRVAVRAGCFRLVARAVVVRPIGTVVITVSLR